MKARFVTWEGELGTVETVGGHAIASNNKVARLIERVPVVDAVLTPADGDRLVQALPLAYSGSRLRAEIVGDEEKRAFLDWLGNDPDGQEWAGRETEAYEVYKAWRETQHPRDSHGRFSHVPGGGAAEVLEGVVPQIEEGVRKNPRRGRPGLRRSAKDWKKHVEAARAAEPINANALIGKRFDAVAAEKVQPELRSEREKELVRWLGEEYFFDRFDREGASRQGRYEDFATGDPGPAFEEQHARIMDAGARIDAEIKRRMAVEEKPYREAKKRFATASKGFKDADKNWNDTSWGWTYDQAIERGWYTPEDLGTREEFVKRGPAIETWYTMAARPWPKKFGPQPEPRFAEDWYLLHAGSYDSTEINHVWDERDEAMSKMFAARREFEVLDHDIGKQRRDTTLEVLKEARPFGGMKLKATNRKEALLREDLELDHLTMAGAEAQTADRALEWANGYLPDDWVDDSNDDLAIGVHPLEYEWTGSVRGEYENADYNFETNVTVGRLGISETPANVRWDVPPGGSVALHELVHRMEYARPAIKGAEWTFYRRRIRADPDKSYSAHERARLLSEIGGPQYTEGEYGRRDDFINVYSGKDYGNTMASSYELLTMGIDDLFSNRNGFIQHDDEFRQFVLGALATL